MISADIRGCQWKIEKSNQHGIHINWLSNILMGWKWSRGGMGWGAMWQDSQVSHSWLELMVLYADPQFREKEERRETVTKIKYLQKYDWNHQIPYFGLLYKWNNIK